VVPYVPFTRFEQSVVAHQELLDLKANLAQPPEEKQNRFHGNINLVLQDQPKVGKGGAHCRCWDGCGRWACVTTVT
jgi:hypothetical protein